MNRYLLVIVLLVGVATLYLYGPMKPQPKEVVLKKTVVVEESGPLPKLEQNYKYVSQSEEKKKKTIFEREEAFVFKEDPDRLQPIPKEYKNIPVVD